jgi:uncharacterized OB-fold protein
MTVPRFWREIPQRYNLQASRCANCEATYFPPREVCPTCRRASIGRMEPVQLSGRGTILEWTRVHKPAPGYEMQVPYVVALIRSTEGPLITGQVVDSDPGSIRSGAAVHSVFRRLGADGEAGVIHYGTKWQVVRDAPVVAEPEEKAPVAAKKRRFGRKA